MDIGFHDQLVGSHMEVVENLVIDDLVVVGGKLCVAGHLVVSNEIARVVRLACVDGDLHVVNDVELVFASVDSLVADVNEVLLMKHYVQFVPRSEHVD